MNSYSCPTHPIINAGLKRLTRRENEMVAMRLRGLLLKQIAFDLGLSHKTVNCHLTNAYKKLKVHNVMELFRVVKSDDLIPWGLQ